MSETPITVGNGQVVLLQTCFPIEAFDWVDEGGNGSSFFDFEDFSSGEGWRLTETGDFVEWEFNLDYTIPSDEVGMQIRSGIDESFSTVSVEYTINDNVVFTSFDDGTLAGTQWRDESSGVLSANGDGYAGPDLEPGSHTIRAECIADTGDEWIDDLVCVYDERFNHAADGSDNSFDNSVHENDGYLDDPQLYPIVEDVAFNTVETQRDVTEASIESDWNNTDNSQYIELRIGEDDFDRSDNSETASTTATEPGRNIDVNIGLSRYPVNTDAQSATPRFGYNAQAIDTYSLFANPSAINPFAIGTAEVEAVVPQGEIVGDRLEEAGQLTESDELLSRSVLAPFDVFESMEIRSSEKTAFDNV